MSEGGHVRQHTSMMGTWCFIGTIGSAHRCSTAAWWLTTILGLPNELSRFVYENNDIQCGANAMRLKSLVIQ